MVRTAWAPASGVKSRRQIKYTDHKESDFHARFRLRSVELLLQLFQPARECVSCTFYFNFRACPLVLQALTPDYIWLYCWMQHLFNNTWSHLTGFYFENGHSKVADLEALVEKTTSGMQIHGPVISIMQKPWTESQKTDNKNRIDCKTQSIAETAKMWTQLIKVRVFMLKRSSEGEKEAACLQELITSTLRTTTTPADARHFVAGKKENGFYRPLDIITDWDTSR